MQHTTNFLLFFHNLFRYFIIIAAITVCMRAAFGFLRKRSFNKPDKLSIMVLQILCDVQLLFGLFLYYSKGWLYKLHNGLDMHDHYSRYYGMEHALSMIIAIVLVHIGFRIAKGKMEDSRKFIRLFWCAFVALFIFVAQTPWQGKKDIGRPNIPTLTEIK